MYAPAIPAALEKEKIQSYLDNANVVRFHQSGGPEVMQLEDLPRPELEQGEVRIKVQAIGVNGAEVMFRTGAYMEQGQIPPASRRRGVRHC